MEFSISTNIEPRSYVPPAQITVGRRVIDVAPDLSAFLGKTLDNVRAFYSRTLNPQQRAIIAAWERIDEVSALQGASAVDYLFLRHHAGGDSLRSLGSEFGLAHTAIGRVFDKLGLPKVDRVKSMTRAKSPGEADVEALKELIRENMSDHEANPDNTQLLTNAELAQLIGTSRGYIAGILDAVLDSQQREYRKRQIIHDTSSVMGTRLRDEGRGIFGVNPETGVTYQQEAAAIGGQRSKELGAGIHGLSSEQRVENGLMGAITSMERKVGIHGLTYEEHQAAGSRGGTISRDKKLGFFEMTPERRSEVSTQNGLKLREEGIGIFGLSSEERIEISRRNGLRAARLGIGIHGVDPETGIPYAVIAGNRSKELGVGVHGLTPEERSRYGLLGSEVANSAKVYTEKEYYDSYLEAVVASSLESYIPGYIVVRGLTYQIPTPNSKKIDFLVNGVLVEFNPILLTYSTGSRGGFDAQEEYKAYLLRLAETPRQEKAQFKKQVRQALKERYFQRRRLALDENPEFKDIELVVVIDPVELYDDVIQRFGVEVPEEGIFLREFNSLLSEVKEEDERVRSQKGFGQRSV